MLFNKFELLWENYLFITGVVLAMIDKN